jgi:glycosyltransferase involved in cell wall biosynthesis
VAPPEGYRRRELFYTLASRVGSARARRALKLAEHVPDMLRYRRVARAADVVHFQWLTVQHLDGWLLPARAGAAPAPRRPLVLTAHDILPREARPGQRTAQRRLYDRFDAIVVHSEHGRRRLTGELGVDPERVYVIPHGVFEHLAAGEPEERAPTRTPFATELPVVLCFGLMRPYKGIDLLLEAWRGIDDAELWIAGMPRMDISALRATAPPGVRFVPRFIGDDELPAYFRRADLVVLPYREIDQSGVLFTALAFGKPLLLSDVGGFPEIAATGAARSFPAGDAGALRDSLRELLDDEPARAALAARAAELAAGEYSWRAIAGRTLALYESLLAAGPSR